MVTFFTVIGGLYVLYLVFKGAWHGKGLLMRRWESRHARQDCYYPLVELGLRILVSGSEYLFVRRYAVVSKQESLQSVPLGLRTTGAVTFGEERIEPSEHVLEVDSTRRGPAPGWQWKQVRLDSPLGKGKKTWFVYIQKLVVTGTRPEPYIRWRTEHRVDTLRLRVVFEQEQPQDAMFTITDSAANILHSERIHVDPLTYEASKEIVAPKLHRQYSISWTESSKAGGCEEEGIEIED